MLGKCNTALGATNLFFLFLEQAASWPQLPEDFRVEYMAPERWPRDVQIRPARAAGAVSIRRSREQAEALC
jgi:hypothetical protein